MADYQDAIIREFVLEAHWDDTNPGKTVALCFERCGFSQYEFANRMGVGQATLNQWLAVEKTPLWGACAALFRCFGDRQDP